MFKLTCDIAACGAEIQSGAGQPTLQAKRDLYCPRCAGYIAAVDREMDVEANRRSFALVEELNALRREKIAQALPSQRDGVAKETEWLVR